MVLQNGLAKQCEVYPELFCDAVCQGIRREIDDQKWLDHVYEKIEASNMQGELKSIAEAFNKAVVPDDDEAEFRSYHELYKEQNFVDDLTGADLDKNLAVKARKLEMDYFQKMGVYSKIRREKA